MSERRQPFENSDLSELELKRYYEKMNWFAKSCLHGLDFLLGVPKHPLESGLRAIGYLGLLGVAARAVIHVLVPESTANYTPETETRYVFTCVTAIIGADVMKIARNSKKN